MIFYTKDDGIRFVTQGGGSSHALNIIKQLEKYNSRNPGKEVLFLNNSAVTTSFTNENCTFFHFRFDSNVDMKVAGLVSHMSRDNSIKKVYLFNQNYVYGQTFKEAATRMLSKNAPNIQIVGDELIPPFGKVQDFNPYVTKIKLSGADTVLTGNWGPDAYRFVNALKDAGVKEWFVVKYKDLITKQRTKTTHYHLSLIFCSATSRTKYFSTQ